MDDFGDELNSFDQKNNNQNNRSNYSNNYNNGGNRGSWKGGNNNYKNFSRKQEPPKDFVLYKPYVVTGNKDTPPSVLEDIRQLVKRLDGLGFIARTDGMDGVDIEVEKTTKNIELYLPWKGFNNKDSKLYYNDTTTMQAAKAYHPTFDNLKPVVQAILGKNARMVLGNKLNSNALFLLCWSEDGAELKKDVVARTGNVGHIILIANSIGIPVFNLGKEGSKEKINTYLSMFN